MFLIGKRFPEDISCWAKGGKTWNTNIVELENGFEQRNSIWSKSRAKYTISASLVSEKVSPFSFENFDNFFQSCRGSLHGYRFKDFRDFKASQSSGCLEKGLGTGNKVYQLTKAYATGNLKYYREIKKPVANTASIFRNAVDQVGNFSIDYETGIVTFQPIKLVNIDSITAGNDVTVTTVSPHTYSNNQIIYLSFLQSNHPLYNKFFPISDVTANTFKLVGSKNSVAVSSQGRADLYPQPTDFLTASFEFDVPCRFDVDNVDAGMGDGGLIELETINIIEIRT